MKSGGALPIKDIKALLDKSYSGQRPSSYGDYEVDPELSDTKVQVYHHKKTGKAVVVHRGTKGFGDVLADVAYATTGYKGKRFKHSSQKQKGAEDKYGAQNVTTLGHSLGTLLSSDVGSNSHEIINYNKPRLPYAKKRENEFNVRTTRDPFSFFKTSKDKNTKMIDSKTFNPVHEHSVDRLSELPEDEMIGHGRGKGLAGLKIADLKALIKDHNRKQRGGSGKKVKGYGKMTKAQLKEAVISMRKSIYGGAVPDRDSRFKDFESVIDDMLEDNDLEEEGMNDRRLIWSDIYRDIQQKVNEKFPYRQYPRGVIIPPHQPNKALRLIAMKHLKKYFDAANSDRGFTMVRDCAPIATKPKPNYGYIEKEVDEYFFLLEAHDIHPTPKYHRNPLVKAVQQSVRNTGVKEGSEQWYDALKHFVWYFDNLRHTYDTKRV